VKITMLIIVAENKKCSNSVLDKNSYLERFIRNIWLEKP